MERGAVETDARNKEREREIFQGGESGGSEGMERSKGQGDKKHEHEPADWIELRGIVTASFLGKRCRESNVSMAKDLLHDLLMSLFGKASIVQLCNTAPSATFFGQVSRALHTVLESRKNGGKSGKGSGWSRRTAQKTVGVLRCIVAKTTAHPALLRALRVLPEEKPRHPVLCNFYGNRSSDDPARMLLEEWQRRLSMCTNNHSVVSQYHIMAFVRHQVLPRLGLTLDNFPGENIAQVLQSRLTEETIRAICTGNFKAVSNKVVWLQTFITSMLQCDTYQIPKLLITQMMQASRAKAKDERAEDDGSDKHRIATQDLEKLYKVAEKNIFNLLFFMTMLTTGVRVSGFIRMKSADVADICDGKWQARTEGTTLEKGNKKVSFLLYDPVRKLITQWLNRHRSFDYASPFLFPGRLGFHISSQMVRERFDRMCIEAELQGPQFHLHSLRHCFSHMMLEAGNPPEVVARLINHTSVSTTNKYYLKESSLEAAHRAYIPWLSDSERAEHSKKRKNPLPSFLQPRTSTTKQAKTRKTEQTQDPQ